jgi:excisionase family DNA binding protein
MPAKNQKKRRTRVTPTRTSEVLNVRMAAELLTVSADTVYDLFKSGELPGRKVARKGKPRLSCPLPYYFFKIVRVL